VAFFWGRRAASRATVISFYPSIRETAPSVLPFTSRSWRSRSDFAYNQAMPNRVGTFEFLVLAIVLELDEQAYAVPIREALEQRTARPVTRGALYTTLARLEDKGLLRSRMSDPLPVRGGKARRYYRLTAAGSRVLRGERARLVAEWRGLGRLLGELP
jgi:DNA-binding PadR family transcriptional regulator